MIDIIASGTLHGENGILFNGIREIYRVIRNDCRGFNNLSYTIHLRQDYMYFFFI